MAQKMTKITISEDGDTVEVDQVGWEGKGCAEAIKKLLSSLGKEVKKTQKPEYYNNNTTTNSNISKNNLKR